MMTTDEIIQKVKVGSVLRAEDGRRFVVRSIRKANDRKEPNVMYTTNDETNDPSIAALEKQLSDLDTLLGSIGKQVDASGQDDGDNADDTIEIAKLQSQVAELGKTLTDAIAAADKSAGDTFVQVADDI